MSFAIRLTKSGIRCEADGNKEPEVRSCRPATLSELLRFWHRDVGGIDLDYTLGDLMELLRVVGGIDQLADMFSCDIDEFLAEAAVPPAARADDLVHLEVYNSAHLIGWVNGPKGRRISGGRFVPPHRVYRGFQGWGPWESDDTPDGLPTEGGIAIEYTPVNELVHLPLRYNAEVRFEKERFQGIVLDTSLTITFGEFVHAVIWEIGFFGTPGNRNAERALLTARVDDLEESIEEGAQAGERFDAEEWMAELDREEEEEA